ncbi:Homocysteine S-methyltransferase [Sarocladium strictum]
MTEILILDGGLGTTLEQQHGVKFTFNEPLWSSSLLVTSPSTLLACQASFTRVPVDVLLTGTYQFSTEGFANTKVEGHPDGFAKEEIAPFVEKAVSVAEDACKQGGGKTGVALSVGPYGAIMVPGQEYSGKYDEKHDSLETLEVWHRERLQILASPKDIATRVRYTALETIPRIDEITAMRKALSATPSLASVPYWICCLFPDQSTTLLPDGTAAGDAVKAMLDSRIPGPLPWGIGINCTKVHRLEPLLLEYEAAVADVLGKDAEWPALVLYPDGTNGEVYNTSTKTWDMPEEGSTTGTADKLPWEEVLSRAVAGTKARGNWKTIVVGGCCMASPEHISRLRSRLLQ